MTLKVECDQAADQGNYDEIAAQVAARIKSSIMVSSEVEVVAYGALPRSERKSKRFFDNRT